jgi:hypothetical protein
MLKADHPSVIYWDRTDYSDDSDDLTEITDKKRNKLKFLEHHNGDPFTKTEIKSLRKAARELFMTLLDDGLALRTWSHASSKAVNAVRRDLLTQFPDLALCSTNWKVDKVASEVYSQWSRRRKDQIDEKTKSRKRKSDPTDAASSSKRAKRDHTSSASTTSKSNVPTSKKSKHKHSSSKEKHKSKKSSRSSTSHPRPDFAPGDSDSDSEPRTATLVATIPTLNSISRPPSPALSVSAEDPSSTTNPATPASDPTPAEEIQPHTAEPLKKTLTVSDPLQVSFVSVFHDSADFILILQSWYLRQQVLCILYFQT